MVNADLAEQLAPTFAAATLVVSSVGAADAFLNDRSTDDKVSSLAWVAFGVVQLAAVFEPRLKPAANTAMRVMLITDAIDKWVG